MTQPIGDARDLGVVLPFPGRKPDQTAYVVPDLDASLATISRLLGIADWNAWTYDAAYQPNRVYKGQPGDFVTMAAVPSYGPSLEVIQPINGPSVFTDFLDARGPGLHHLGWFVPSLAEVRAWYRERGVDEVMSGSGHGVRGDGAWCYFDVTESLGMYLEYIEVPAERHPPHRSYHFDV